jgi:phosphoglycolate phosphatase
LTIRAIIFDLDGTLVDAYPGIHQSLNESLRALNLPEVDLYTVKRRVGRGVRNLIQQSVPPTLVERGIELFRASYDKTHLSGTFLLPDVKETLTELHSRNIGMSVASNKPAEFTRNILRHFQIDSYFSMCAGPEGEIKTKPHPSMLLHLMESMKVSPYETIYVGDMTLDAETARNAGVRLALIPSGGHELEELRQENPDYLLERFSDLLRVTERGN